MGQILHGSATTQRRSVEQYKKSREAEGSIEAQWDQSEDRCQMEEANVND